MNFRIDFGRGFVPLPERERAITEDRDLKFFIASQIDRQDGHCYPVVMAIYLAPFDWMAEQNLTYKEGPPMISSYQTFALRTGLYNINVRDSLVIYSDLKLTYLAFALDTNGIFVCPYPTKDLGNIDVRRLVCESS